MVWVEHSMEIIPGKAWNETREVLRKVFKHEKETHDREVFFMTSLTGKRNKIVVAGFYESQAAHEEYVKKLGDDKVHAELMKSVKNECFVQGSLQTVYYGSIE